MHAYYRGQGIEYRYLEKSGKRKKFKKTSRGANKYWELEYCINYEGCPLDTDTKNNLSFLIRIRHEIEHQMTRQIDAFLSAKLQACAINFDYYLTQFFGAKFAVSKELAISIQFSAITPTQSKQLGSLDKLTNNVRNFIAEFEDALSEDELRSTRYAYRVLYTLINVNRKGQADSVIEFVKPGSSLANDIERVLVKEIEKAKFLPSAIVAKMQQEGYSRFKMPQHTDLWKKNYAKDPGKGFGILVSKQWYWYNSWLEFVQKHCQENAVVYQ
jgi:hypothetical protein